MEESVFVANKLRTLLLLFIYIIIYFIHSYYIHTFIFCMYILFFIIIYLHLFLYLFCNVFIVKNFNFENLMHSDEAFSKMSSNHSSLVLTNTKYYFCITCNGAGIPRWATGDIRRLQQVLRIFPASFSGHFLGSKSKSVRLFLIFFIQILTTEVMVIFLMYSFCSLHLVIL